jgi:peptide/nickel transport system permease protein
MLETLGADYIRTARAKGLRNTVVVYKHALRNAAIPVVTVLGLQVGVLFGGAVITEYVFSYPGMGRLALEAISYRDFSVVQAFVFVVALVIAGANLAVDLLYGVIDPRIRYR